MERTPENYVGDDDHEPGNDRGYTPSKKPSVEKLSAKPPAIGSAVMAANQAFARADVRSINWVDERKRRWTEALSRQAALSRLNDAGYTKACKEQERLWLEYKAASSSTGCDTSDAMTAATKRSIAPDSDKTQSGRDLDDPPDTLRGP